MSDIGARFLFLFSTELKTSRLNQLKNLLIKLPWNRIPQMKFIQTSARKKIWNAKQKATKKWNFHISFMLFSSFFRLIKHLFYDKRRARANKRHEKLLLRMYNVTARWKCVRVRSILSSYPGKHTRKKRTINFYYPLHKLHRQWMTQKKNLIS